MAPSQQGFATRLAGLFDAARETIASVRADAHKAFTASEEQLTVMENEDGNGWRTEPTNVRVNILTQERGWSYADQLADWLEECRTLAKDLAAEFAANLPLWSPMAPFAGLQLVGLSWHDFRGDDPLDCVLGHAILQPTYRYVTHLPTAARSDDTFASALADEAIQILTTGRVIVRQAIAMGGVTAVASREPGDLMLRA